MTEHNRLLDRLLSALDVEIEDLPVCEMARGGRLDERPHATIEAHYVVSGTLHYQVKGNPPITCGPGTVLLAPPNIDGYLACGAHATETVAKPPHRISGDDGWLHVALTDGGQCDLRVVSGCVKPNVAGSVGWLDSIRAPIVASLGDSPLIGEAYRALQREVNAPGLGSRAITEALMKACVVLMLREHHAKAERFLEFAGASHDPRLGRVVALVLQSPSARHSLEGLAKAAGMSRSAFVRKFGEAFSISPMAFVAQTRLHRAAALLTATRLPVKLIAATTGFSSRSHFSTAFRDAHGVAPSAYRDRVKAQAGVR